jgi:hypothetical protein
MKIAQLISLTFILAISSISHLIAQQLTTNEYGQKIVVFSDGSWRYADESDLKELGQTASENPIANVKKSEEEEDIAIAIKIAEKAVAAEQEAIKQEENAQYKRILLEDEIQEIEDNDDGNTDELPILKEQLKMAKKEEKKAKKERKEAAKKVRAAEALMTMTKPERLNALKDYDDYQGMKATDSEVATEDRDANPGGTKTETPTSKESQQEPALLRRRVIEERPYAEFAKYEKEKDVMFNPPKPNCNLSFDGVDEFSGKKRKDVEAQLFFTYTNDELRSIFKDRDYMECTGYLSGLSGGLTFLTLNITINSKSAQREYGILEKGALINVKLLSGDNVKLVNSKTNMGTADPIDGSVTYRAQYLISSGDEKQLKKSEVDKVRIIWSSGYEDYEVYELDFFIDQFKCLDQ